MIRHSAGELLMAVGGRLQPGSDWLFELPFAGLPATIAQMTHCCFVAGVRRPEVRDRATRCGPGIPAQGTGA